MSHRKVTNKKEEKLGNKNYSKKVNENLDIERYRRKSAKRSCEKLYCNFYRMLPSGNTSGAKKHKNTKFSTNTRMFDNLYIFFHNTWKTQKMVLRKDIRKKVFGLS